MGIEEIKLIMESLNNMGESAKDAFIWWLLVKTLPSFIIGVMWIFLVGIVIKTAANLFRNHFVSENIRRAAGLYYHSSKRDTTALIIKLNKLREEGHL